MIWIDESTKWSHVYSQPEVCEIIFPTNLTKSLFSEVFQNSFDKYHFSIEIDIEQAYADKMDGKIHSLDV